MTGYDASDLTGMMEKVTAGATGALGTISMTGYSSDDLSSMMEQVTAGATGALGNISMTGYSSDNLSSMMEKVTAGATGALGNISMDGYDAADLSGMVTKITSGATGALGNISMDGYDNNDLSGMVTNITSGATGALGDISMDGYSSDNLTDFTSTITSSVTDSLSNITMTGYDPNTDNLSSSVTSGASSAGFLFLGSDNVSGTYSSSVGGIKHTGGCMDSTYFSPWAAFMPSGTAGFKHQTIITSSTSFTSVFSAYSDSSCSTSLGYMKFNFKDIVVGSTLTALTTGSSPARPSSAYQVQYSNLDVISKGETTLAVSFLDTYFSTNSLGSVTHSLGVEQRNPLSATWYSIWATKIIDNSTWLYLGTQSLSTYPTDWTIYDGISFK
jgi:hypothetical protein